MTVRQIFGMLFASLVLAFVAIFLVGGYAPIWLTIFFFVFLLSQEGVQTSLRAWGNGGASVFKWLKGFSFTVLAIMVLIALITRMTGKTLESVRAGQDALALILFVALLGLFAAKEAGWTTGVTGKKWVIRLFVASLIYAILSSIFPALPNAVDRFTADGDWIAQSYAKRKLKEELRKAWGDGIGGLTPAVAAQRVTEPPSPFLPDGTLRPNLEMVVFAGETKEYLLRPEGILLLDGHARITCVSCSSLLENKYSKEEGQALEINMPEHYRRFSTRPRLHNLKNDEVFRVQVEAVTDFSFKTRPFRFRERRRT